MKQATREIIKMKFGGKCAYCGCELENGWHVDEVEPVRRKRKFVQGYWEVNGERHRTDAEIQEAMDNRTAKWVEGRWVPDGYEHPERLTIENQFPACASCNINKHSMSLEQFRNLIAGFIKSLNRDSTQYKFAKRYGLLRETSKPVVFYFETFKKQ